MCKAPMIQGIEGIDLSVQIFRITTVCNFVFQGYEPMILLDMLVLAALTIQSLPNSSTLAVRCSWIYLQASL